MSAPLSFTTEVFVTVPVRTIYQEEDVKVMLATLKQDEEAKVVVSSLCHTFQGRYDARGALLSPLTAMSFNSIEEAREKLLSEYKKWPKMLGLKTPMAEVVNAARDVARTLGGIACLEDREQLHQGQTTQGRVSKYVDNLMSITVAMDDGAMVITRRANNNRVIQTDENGVCFHAHDEIATLEDNILRLRASSWMDR